MRLGRSPQGPVSGDRILMLPGCTISGPISYHYTYRTKNYNYVLLSVWHSGVHMIFKMRVFSYTNQNLEPLWSSASCIWPCMAVISVIHY